MVPETWQPTSTLVTGFNVPVADTSLVKSPRTTAVVWYCTTPSRSRRKYHNRPAMTAAQPAKIIIHLPQLLRLSAIKVKLYPPNHKTTRALAKLRHCLLNTTVKQK